MFRFPFIALALLTAVPAQALSALAMKALCADPVKASGNAEEAKKQAIAGAAAFELRKDPAKAREAIAAFEASLAADAGQPELRVQLARALYLQADGYDRLAEKDDEMVAGFQKGMTVSGAAVALINPAFRRKICTNAPLPEAIATLDRASVPAVYWFSTHMGKYGLSKDMLEVLANKDFIYAVMDALRRLQRDYYHFAPERYLGGYFTKVPFPKGDPAEAFKFFRESMRGAPGYFATYNLVAEMYAPRVTGAIDPRSEHCQIGSKKIPDSAPIPMYHPCRGLFEKLLKTVIDGKADALPGMEAEQAVEQQKAAKLIKEIDTFFPPLK